MLNLPLNGPDSTLPEVTHDGKTIKIGDRVMVHAAGQRKTVVVTSLVRAQGHYWVLYDDNQQRCPWPLVKLAR